MLFIAFSSRLKRKMRLDVFSGARYIVGSAPNNLFGGAQNFKGERMKNHLLSQPENFFGAVMPEGSQLDLSRVDAPFSCTRFCIAFFRA